MIWTMPSTTPPVDGKSRQSSGGRSFFGRRLHREKNGEPKVYDEGGLLPDLPSGASSTNGSKSSRHSHRASAMSMDMSNPNDTAGLSMTAGVITSIPYDSVAADRKTPIPVDYLPRSDHIPTRKEPLPHHLNKGGGDYHQYPTWNQTSPPPEGTSHPTGPRPPPKGPQSTISTVPSRDKGGYQQQPGRPGIAAGYTNGSHDTYSTADSSMNHRNSFDQASVYSSISSATRGSSIFSSDNSSRTAIPSPTHDNSFLRPSTSHSSTRQSSAHQSTWQPQQPNAFSSTTSFSPEGFYLPRPSDDRIIESQFLSLMHKRGWQNLPDQAKRQMLAYPSAKKWTLVHQDKLTEWQGEQKRRANARNTVMGSDGQMNIMGRADEEGSPEWFVKKVMEDSITAKQLQSLSVSLRTQPIR